MNNLLEERWNEMEEAHRLASKAAWAAVARSMRQPMQWMAQVADLLTWVLQLTAVTITVAFANLIWLKPLAHESFDLSRTAITCGIGVAGLVFTFCRRLWPASPFRTTWLSAYKSARANGIGYGKNV